MYRARTVRDKIVKEREVREKMTAEERAKYMEKRALMLAEKKRAMIARRESEREANENATLAHEEAMQRVRGDKCVNGSIRCGRQSIRQSLRGQTMTEQVIRLGTLHTDAEQLDLSGRGTQRLPAGFSEPPSPLVHPPPLETLADLLSYE